MHNNTIHLTNRESNMTIQQILIDLKDIKSKLRYGHNMTEDITLDKLNKLIRKIIK